MKQAAFIVVILSVLVSLVSCLDGGTFTVNCAPLTIQRSDPLVQPGIASSHVHSVVGGNVFERTMGPMGNQATLTSCDKEIDHSNYWVPQLYHLRSDKMWEMVKFGHNAVYYQLRACDYAPDIKNCQNSKIPMAFPDGFRMVAGDPFRRTQNDSDPAQRAVHMVCLTAGGKTLAQGPGFPKQHCLQLRAEVYFPSCWDGKNLDSDDHKTHMAYPAIGDFNGGVCPESHPVALFSLFYEFFYDTGPYTDLKFAFANGDPTAYGFHGDFIMGWTNRTLLQTAHKDCVTAANCPKLGNQPAEPRDLIHPAIYEEDIGLTNPIASLPGNNTVIWPTM